MDKSEEYILMCSKAKEIQKEWKPKKGDYIWGETGLFNDEPYIWVIGDNINYDKKLSYYECSYCEGNYNDFKWFIWLPTQSQLQEMVDYTVWFEKIYRFYDWIQKDKFDSKWESIFDKFKSLEQLWLGFIMWEKYQKEWNGSEWIKR